MLKDFANIGIRKKAKYRVSEDRRGRIKP